MRCFTLSRALCALSLATLGCESTTAAVAPVCAVDAGVTATDARAVDAAAVDAGAVPSRPEAQPVEYVSLEIDRDTDATDAVSFLDRLFGDAASRGMRHANLELQPGVFLSALEDPRTADQVILQVEMLPPGDTRRRVVTRVAASYAYGRVFLDGVRAALARSTEREARERGSMSPWELAYRAESDNGGRFVLTLAFRDGAHSLHLAMEGPRTSLRRGSVNRPARSLPSSETIGGTVNFTLSRDEFAFFTNRAYGITSGAAQNFRDFQLEPHNWLRITVTPQLRDELVDVGFEVVTPDGRRVAFARAPASYHAGDQFQQNVFRLMDNMRDAERARPGSSRPFSSTFYYDDPAGGGVVRVILTGRAGRFSAAYTVESPARPTRDVDFVPYMSGLTIPAELPRTAQTCEELGSTTAVRGRFRLRFDASSTVRSSMNLDGPLRGGIWGDIYRASDVTITGPRDGAQPVASFQFDNVDLTDRNRLMEYDVPTELAAGSYQILGFMDIDGNADRMRSRPDTNDPVTLPIGSYTMQCAVQRATVEFALLLPAGR